MDFLGLSLTELIRSVGYLGIFGIIFAESGLLIGFFLPGDSLLFTAGVLSSQGYLSLGVLIFLSLAGAVLGDNVGYSFGKKVGPLIFTKEESWFFRKDHLERAALFYEKYGGLTLVLARFLPFIRTFAPILAGVGRMPYRVFLFYNFLGGMLWAVGLPLIGFYLGRVIPDVDKYLLPLVLAIITLTAIPGAVHFLKVYQAYGRERR